MTRVRLTAGVAAALLLQMPLGAALAGPGSSQSEARTLGLAASVALARSRNPLPRAHALVVDAARLDARRARARNRPDIGASFAAGLVPEARGDAFASPDLQTDLDGLGPFYRVELELVQPIFTFGKIAAATQVADGRVDLAATNRDRALDDLAMAVTRAYWAMLAAERGARVARDLGDQYDVLIAEVERRAASPGYETDDVDVFEARSNRYDVERARLEAADQLALGARRLNALLYFDLEQPIVVEPQATPVFALQEADFGRLVTLAESEHPELRLARSAIRIAEAAVNGARAANKPDVFTSGFFRWAHAGNRTDQKNPFVVDNFNFRSLGWFVGMRWNLNFDRHQLGVAQQRATLGAAQARYDALRARVEMEVYEAYRSAAKNVALLAAAGESRIAAEDGLRVSLDLWELGIGQAFRLLRLYERWFRLQQLEIERELELNVSLATLARSIGDVDLYLGWLEEGTVAVH